MMQRTTTVRLRLGFQLRLILSLGFLSLLVALVAVFALWGLANLRESARRAATDSQASRLAEEVAMQALLCRRYEKDFFLSSGDLVAQDRPLQQWHQTSIDLLRAIKNFEDAAVSDADKQQASGWRDAWRSYVQGFGRVEIGINSGEIKTPFDALKAFEPFQENIQIMTDQAVQRAREKNASANQTSLLLDTVTSTTIGEVMAVAALVVVASIIWSLLFPAWLMRPIKVLHETALRLARGDLTARAALQRNDELGVLANSFDDMAVTIQRSTADLESQYASANSARAMAEDAHRKIAEQLAMIEEQRMVIQEMSVPILPLNATTLVLPLVGALDSTRIHQAQGRALEVIQHTATRHMLLDITGVPVIDSQVGQGLLQIVAAAHLLGCTVVIVGIRPEVAQAVVGLGLDLGHVVTRSTLQSGIAYTLQASG
jgi:rsbT co-antagonist protein RsbR